MTNEKKLQHEIDSIVNTVPLDAFFDLVQEEAAELIHAVAKLKRSLDYRNVNPTTIAPADAWAQAREEYTDLLLDVDLLNRKQFYPEDQIWMNESIRRGKIRRWYSRLVKSGVIKEDGTDDV